MSYNTSVDDEADAIQVVPPLSHKELTRFPDLTKGEKYRVSPEFFAAVESTTVETDVGTLTSNVCPYILVTDPSGAHSRYHLLDHLQSIVDTYPDHKFLGYIQFLGEDGAIFRVVVNKDRKVQMVFPKLTWPDA